MRRTFFVLMIALTLPVMVSGQAVTRLASSPQTAGTMTTSGDVVDFPIPIGIGYGSLGVEARGTWTGTVAVQCIASQGGGTYAALILSPRASTTTVTSFTANGQWSTSIVGGQKVRATATAAMTGTVTITMIASFAGGGSGAGGGGSGCAGTAGTPCVVTGNGTAGTADAGVVTIQGIASGTVVPVAPATGAFATDVVFGTATYTETTTTGPAQYVRNDTPDALVGTTNEIGPAGTSALGGVWMALASDPCSYKAKSMYVVNLAAAATVEIANAVSGEFWYICSVNLVVQGAAAVLIAHDDTDGCGSITAGMNGGTTAATGWGFAANGGIALGNGLGTILKSATANHYLCIAPSTTAQVSGTIFYVSAP